MKSRPSALRDFTVDHRAWFMITAPLVLGTGRGRPGGPALAGYRICDKYLPLLQHQLRDGWSALDNPRPLSTTPSPV
jgi:hypothetical protein